MITGFLCCRFGRVYWMPLRQLGSPSALPAMPCRSLPSLPHPVIPGRHWGLMLSPAAESLASPAVEDKSNPRAPLSQRGPSCRRTGIGLIGRDGGFWKLDPVHTGGGSQAQLRARRFFSSLSGVLHNFYQTKPSEILQMGPALLCSLLVVCCDCFCPEHLQKFYPLRGVLNLLRSL